MSCLADIASQIYLDLSEPDDISVPAIAYWLQTSIGKINTLLDTSYVYDETTGNFSPQLGTAEAEIYKKMYEVNFYGRQFRKNTGAAAHSEEVIEIKEGNRTVKAINKNEIAKNYLAAQKEANKELTDLIQSYRMNAADPRQTLVVDDHDFGYGTSSFGFWRSRMD